MLSDDPFDDPDDAETDLRPDDPSDGLEIEIPEVPDPSDGLASDFSDADVDPELAREFWSLVLLFNVALFAMGLGLMLVGFERMWQLGGAVFLVGVVAFVRGWYRYESVRKD